MKAPILFLLLFIVQTLSFSQNKYDFNFTIQSESFEKERKFYVHVPESYHSNSTDSFGVVYLLDGQGREYYNHAKNIIDYLVWSYQIMPVIVVGIHSDDRGPEFVPKSRSAKDENDNGQAHMLTDHIRNEILPIVSDSFRVTNFRAIVGHSRGGAFVANTLFSKERDLFNAYISISPGMHYVDNQIIDDAEKMIKEQTIFNKFYFCSYGTVGSLERYFEPQVLFLDSLIEANPNESLVWSKYKSEGKTHWSTVASSLVEGLLEMSRSYQVDQYLIEKFASNKSQSLTSQIDDYYARQTNRLGFTVPISAGELRYFGNEFSESEDFKTAVQLYDISLDRDPLSINAYFGKAWCHQSLNELNKAKECYNKAKEVLKSGKVKMSQEKVERWNKNINEALLKLEE